MNIKIGTIIRELRSKSGITQEKLASHLGISVQAVSRWESETCYPDLEFIPKIANYFRVSADYLLGINRYDTAETAAEYERKWTAAVKNRTPLRRWKSSRKPSQSCRKIMISC